MASFICLARSQFSSRDQATAFMPPRDGLRPTVGDRNFQAATTQQRCPALALTHALRVQLSYPK
ncbi:hypothetical protein [Nostoc sp. UHCC 0870]|uniref:hypothetical protein n=1 Tax=Nostoc sp. UHCC 0870 TaxID=2914041 RepID=UPI001EDEB81B|nr:hypothetical protein [Nostoc sp. UHCC 0870]UKP01309.1 hypothetical protein L6494_29310 [Nostoc sp. UHCC 0870]